MRQTSETDARRLSSLLQVVEVDGDVLEKPHDAAHAESMLRRCVRFVSFMLSVVCSLFVWDVQAGHLVAHSVSNKNTTRLRSYLIAALAEIWCWLHRLSGRLHQVHTGVVMVINLPSSGVPLQPSLTVSSGHVCQVLYVPSASRICNSCR